MMESSSLPLFANREQTQRLIAQGQPPSQGFDRSHFPSDEPLNKFSRIKGRQRNSCFPENGSVSSPLNVHFREATASPQFWFSSTRSQACVSPTGHSAQTTWFGRPRSSAHYSRLSEPSVENGTFPDPAALTHGTIQQEANQDSRFRQLLFVIVVCSAQFLSLAGLTQTFAPIIVLSNSLNIDNPETIAWPTAAYSLALGVCILIAGRLGDLLGHRMIFVIGWLWFGFSSVACGFSFYGGWKMLTACRAIQGVGPALLVPNALALISRKFPMGAKRNIVISLFAGSGPCGVATGAAMSSLFSQLVWWPWQFWAMAFACITLSALALAVIPSESDATFAHSWREFWRFFDLLGACTGIAGLTLIGVALIQGPIDGNSNPLIITFLGLGVVLICVFSYVELRVASRPLVPLRSLGTNVAFTLVCICAGWGSNGIWCFFLFLRLESIQGYKPLEACAQFWPVAPIGFSAAVTVGFLVRKVKVAYILTVAMLAFSIGSALLATASVDHEYTATLFSVLITPFGMNWSFPTAVILISGEVAREHQGIAASLVATILNFGTCTGLGLAGNIVHSVTPTHGILAAYRAAWYFGAALGGFGLLVSLCFIWRLRKSK